MIKKNKPLKINIMNIIENVAISIIVLPSALSFNLYTGYFGMKNEKVKIKSLIWPIALPAFPFFVVYDLCLRTKCKITGHAYDGLFKEFEYSLADLV